MKISRRVVNNDGTARKEEKVLTINVKPGWKSGTKITFQREGDQAPNKIPADIVFIIRDKPHPNFKREGSDLKHTCRISLKEVGKIYKIIFIRESRFHFIKRQERIKFFICISIMGNFSILFIILF